MAAPQPEQQLQLRPAATAAKTGSKAASAEEEHFGSQVPFAEPYWYNTFKSPHYNDSHRAFRAKVRAFIDEHVTPFCGEWDEAGTYPKELHEKAYKAGIYAAMWPTEYGGTPPQGCDPFHDLILVDELCRCASGGLLWSVFFTFGIALPPLLNEGSKDLKDEIARDVITGKVIMSLAVTEPTAGSDVAGLSTTAIKEGDFYVVNGLKKFITGGTRASYFTTAVRTGGPGMGGVSVLIIPANLEGVKTTRMKTQGWWMSSTALVAFDNVRVPARYLVGKEGQGFKYIMRNFNHERFVLAAMANRYARVMLEEAIRYGRTRRTFGKRLMDHQVLRHKVADMARQVESCHAMLEQVAYQMKAGVADEHLAGMIAMTKVSCTRCMDLCARESTQIIGGAACVRGGPGEKVERLYREVRINAIGGGSEEILLDLCCRQAKL